MVGNECGTPEKATPAPGRHAKRTRRLIHRNGGRLSFAQSYSKQQQQQQQSQQQQHQDITNTLVQTVKEDVELWEKAKQWTFSCYSPAKETACVPGMEDVSPEEMRLDCYEARASGEMEDFHRRYQELLKEYAVKRRAMLNPNEAFKEVLGKIYNWEDIAGVDPVALFQ